MPTRAFSIEDGNLGVKTIISSQNRTFSDIDLTFAKKASGDVFKKNCKGAPKTCTPECSKVFNPFYDECSEHLRKNTAPDGQANRFYELGKKCKKVNIP